FSRDWSSDVCSSDLHASEALADLLWRDVSGVYVAPADPLEPARACGVRIHDVESVDAGSAHCEDHCGQETDRPQPRDEAAPAVQPVGGREGFGEPGELDALGLGNRLFDD